MVRPNPAHPSTFARTHHIAHRRKLHLSVTILMLFVLSLPMLPVPLSFTQPAPVANAQSADEAFSMVWSSVETDSTKGLAWGDYDNDGDLDLAVANLSPTSRLYRNDNGVLTSIWTPLETYSAEAVAWGDYDNDGDLDLAIGGTSCNNNDGCPNWLYRNDGGLLTKNAIWSSNESDTTTSLVWGDIDGDGDLDLIAGNSGDPNRMYRNDNGALTASAVWSSAPEVPLGGSTFGHNSTNSIVLGDIDRDGDLDLVVGNGQWSGVWGSTVGEEPNRIYENINGTLTTTAAWSFPYTDHTMAIDLGDYDKDGDLDLLVGNARQANRVYKNISVEQGITTLSGLFVLGWQAPNEYDTWGIAWGDYDNDGDLDIGMGNIDARNAVFRNDAGAFTAAWWSLDSDFTRDIAWADADNDGDLDLTAVNSGQPKRIYFNTAGYLLPATGTQVVSTPGWAHSVALGDYDNDGDLDLAIGNASTGTEVYRNDTTPATNNVFTSIPVWSSGGSTCTYLADTDCIRDVAWGDYDNDGDLDLVTISSLAASKLYRNDGLTADTLAPILTEVISFGAGNWGAAGAWGDYDNDGDLDLAVANGYQYGWNAAVRQSNHLYRNDGVDTSGQPVLTLIWTSQEQDGSLDVAWGDYDNDGDLDLVFANEGTPSRLYRNENGALTASAVWSSGEGFNTRSVAWGDYDNDGDLDLATGNRWQPNRLYKNDHGTLTSDPVWSSYGTSNTFAVAWSDYDNDGDLDLTAGNMGWTGQGNKLYPNDNGVLRETSIWEDTNGDPTSSLAWGDVNNDGDLDLVAGNGSSDYATGYTRLYLNRRNDGSSLDTPPTVALKPSTGTAQATFFATPNIKATPLLPIQYILQDLENDSVHEVRASYSSDGGGHWLPAIATSDTITRNLTTQAQATAQINTQQSIPDNGVLTSQATLGGSGAVRRLETELTINHTSNRQLAAELWAPWPNALGTTVSLFDNLTTAGPNPVTIRFSDAATQQLGGGLSTTTTSYNSTDVPKNIPDRKSVSSILSVSNGGTIADVDVINLNGTHTYIDDLVFTLQSPAGTKVTLMSRPCGAEDNFNLSLDDEASGTWPCPPTGGGTYLPASSLTAFDGQNSTGTWTLQVQDSARGDTGKLNGWGLRITTQTTAPRSLSNGTYKPDQLLSAFDGMPLTTPITLRLRDKTAGQTGSLTAWSLSATGGAAVHTYTWDTFASGFFGQSDNVVFRLEALPDVKPAHNRASDSYQYASTSAQSNPFRVRGAQVRVVDAGGSPVSRALVYRLPAGQEQGGNPIVNGGTEPFMTDPQGYLQGRGQLALGDRLLALAPVVVSDTFTLYHTNGMPTELGVDTPAVETPGVQTLTVSPQHPLILFNLTVALEWDASRDPSYLQQVAFNLQRASQYLYDFTNGQVALGQVTVTQNADDWAYAEVVIRAANDLRPYAIQGGIVLTPTVDPQHPDIEYDTGQVTMGSVWNRYGNPGETLGEDWPLVLAHELGHYLLYQEDVYLGLDIQGLLRTVDTCIGSAMGDPYTDPRNTEFIADPVFWSSATGCKDTLANQTLHRDEWDTIRLWYPDLHAPTQVLAGPAQMPFSLTSVQIESPITLTNALEDPTFYLDYTDNGVASTQTEVYLLRDLDSDSNSDFVIPLGGPLGGQNRIKAHGAQVGDRLCAFDPQHQHFGCETIEPGDDRLTLVPDATWQPVIQLTLVTSTTFALEVDNLPDGLALKARLYPELGAAYDAISLTRQSNMYTGTFLLDLPELAGHIQLWVDEPASESDPLRETIVAYTMGGNPGRTRRSGTDMRGGGGRTRRSGTDMRGGGGRTRRSGSPIVSPDGQMTFYTPNPLKFAEGELYAIQSMAGLPDTPAGRTMIGQGYRVITTPGAPDLTGSISFEYLTNDVLVAGVEEEDLKIYHWDGTKWAMLPTVVDAYYNFASAPSRGTGIYALMAGVEIGLYTPGWNLISYPMRGTRAVTEALRSIEGDYSQIFGFAPDGESNPWTPYLEGSADSPWRRYDVSLPLWANTLTELEFGRGYWVNITSTEVITLYLSKDQASLNALNSAEVQQTTLPPPPAVFYGTVLASDGFIPEAGLDVIARIGDALCGRTTTRDVGGQIVYVVDVLSASSGSSAGCGTGGNQVTFEVEGMPMNTTGVWDNTRSQSLTLQLTPADTRLLYLPLVAR